MKNLVKMMMVLAVLLVMGVGQVWAYQIADDDIYLTVTSGQEGGYGVSLVGSNDILFTTFCLEKDVYFYYEQSPKSQVYTATINETVMTGTKESQESRGALAEGTKYLYWNFVHNQDEFNSVSWSDDKAGITALQQAIWALQRPLLVPVNKSRWPDVVPTGLALDLYTLANNNATMGAGYDVKVMNLWTTNGGAPVQSQLIAGPAPVPEPGTLLLLGSGLAGLALYRRRTRK